MGLPGIDPALTSYIDILPFFLSALIISLFLTPLVGKLAHKVGALDLPASMRKNGEDTSTRINSKITARLGGLVIVVTIGAVLFLSEQIGFSNLSDAVGFNSKGVWLGLLILTVAGVYDDIKDMPAWAQFVAQFAAAIVVVVSGVTFDSISIGNEIFQSFGEFGNIIIIFWIVAIMNFVNWASGVDALHGSLTSVAGATLMLIALQSGNPILATLIAIHLGANLGVLPFNYNPSKIFYGFGESINGFLLAVFAISGDIKFATSLVILGLPLIDAIWVAINRIRRRAQTTNNIFKLLSAPMKGDKTHLHHRLLELGYSWKTVVLIELLIMVTFSIAAFLFSGFSLESRTTQLALSVITLILIFIVINIARKRIRQQRLEQEFSNNYKPKPEIRVVKADSNSETEEEKYIY